jgi:predicted nucleic acid-binding protein
MSPVRARRQVGGVRDQGPQWPAVPVDERPFLLSVDLVLALLDPAHALHEAAHTWFEGDGARYWATCPLVENGVIRIASRSTYPNSPGTSQVVAGMLDSLCRLPGHRFWSDSISLRDHRWFDVCRHITSAQVSDIYLLGLAVANGGRLATFDRRLDTSAVHGGADALHLVP